MARRFIRCPKCYGRIATAEDADDEFDLNMHRLSGFCRAADAPKERKPRTKTVTRLDNLLGGDY